MSKKEDEDKLLEKLVADGKLTEASIETRLAAVKALQGVWKDLPAEDYGKTLCPWEPRACEWVSTYRCTKECEFHPESYHMEKEVLEQFEKKPWAVYCLTCGEFLDSRYGHAENHVVATGVMEYREKIPQFTMERMTQRQEETGDMSW